MSENIKEKLYIPQGLNTNKEFMKGLEIKAIGLAFLITIFLNIANIILSIFFIRNLLFSIMYLTISIMISFTLVIKDNNISMIDMILFLVNFIKNQKKYEYIAKDEWS